MEWFILVVLSVVLLGAVLANAVIIIFIVQLYNAMREQANINNSINNFNAPQTTGINPQVGTDSPNAYTPADSVNQEVPLDQFEPDFNKPMKFVINEDEDQPGIEEVEDNEK